MRPIFTFPTILLAFLLTQAAVAQSEKSDAAKPNSSTGADSAAERAWAELLKASQPPRPPEVWQTKAPTDEEIARFKQSEAKRLAKAADLAKDFQARFPNHPDAEEASTKEYEALQIALELGDTSVLDRLQKIEEARLKDPNTSEDERFRLRATAVNRSAMSKLSEGMAAALAELEKGARSLQKDFPKRPDSYQMLLAVASGSEPGKARQIIKEIADSSAPEEIKGEAREVLKKMERLGKPVDIKFTAVDGRRVELQKLRGKVVLVDFWATWCGPCVKEVPNVRSTYEKLHPKGFEIIGISFDREKQKLLSFIEREKMTWPQYFDGKQWDNDFGKQFGIQGIPTMWLIDKKGNLRDLNARDDLADKVEKLLAETP